jgi:hypothetical protein
MYRGRAAEEELMAVGEEWDKLVPHLYLSLSLSLSLSPSLQ